MHACTTDRLLPAIKRAVKDAAEFRVLWTQQRGNKVVRRGAVWLDASDENQREVGQLWGGGAPWFFESEAARTHTLHSG